mgnify:CR=1 FL=1
MNCPMKNNAVADSAAVFDEYVWMKHAILADFNVVTNLCSEQLVREAGDERVPFHFHPESLLLRKTLGRGRNLGERLTIAGAGVIHHGDVAAG